MASSQWLDVLLEENVHHQNKELKDRKRKKNEIETEKQLSQKRAKRAESVKLKEILEAILLVNQIIISLVAKIFETLWPFIKSFFQTKFSK